MVSQWLFAKLVFLGGFFRGLFWLLLSWEPLIYLYIGITSLYLYNSIRFRFLQDGIFHKFAAKLVCKSQNPGLYPIFPLTFFSMRDIFKVLGDAQRPFLSVC